MPPCHMGNGVPRRPAPYHVHGTKSQVKLLELMMHGGPSKWVAKAPTFRIDMEHSVNVPPDQVCVQNVHAQRECGNA